MSSKTTTATTTIATMINDTFSQRGDAEVQSRRLGYRLCPRRSKQETEGQGKSRDRCDAYGGAFGSQPETSPSPQPLPRLPRLGLTFSLAAGPRCLVASIGRPPRSVWGGSAHLLRRAPSDGREVRPFFHGRADRRQSMSDKMISSSKTKA